jgi:hypothetical protein
MKNKLIIVLLIPYALVGGLFYGVIADRLFKEREPWFTTFMLFGLAVSISVLASMCHASYFMAFGVFVGTGIFYTASRLMFGKGSAVEMFYGPHLIAIMIILLHPSLVRAQEKAKYLRDHSIIGIWRVVSQESGDPAYDKPTGELEMQFADGGVVTAKFRDSTNVAATVETMTGKYVLVPPDRLNVTFIGTTEDRYRYSFFVGGLQMEQLDYSITNTLRRLAKFSL